MPRSTWPELRSKLLFGGGMATLWFELLFRRPPDLVVIPIIAGMLGLESFLKKDGAAHDPAPVPDPVRPTDLPAPRPPARPRKRPAPPAGEQADDAPTA